MRFKPYTFLFLSQQSKKSLKVKLSKVRFLLFFALLLFILFSWLFFTYKYFDLNNKLKNYEEIKIRNRRLGQKFYSYKARLDEIEKTVERVNIIIAKLKVVSNLSDPTRLSHVDLESDYEIMEDIDSFNLASNMEIENQFLNAQVKLKDIEHKISFQEEQLAKFSEYLTDQSALLASTPSLMPVKGWVTSNFGVRRDPFTQKIKPHEGIDIASRIGTPIIAPADGIVTYTGTKPGYGLLLVIDHGYGISTRYGHNSRFFVSQGMRVKRGMPISAVGNTGRSTGPHLHYEVRINGVPVNPNKFILDDPWGESF
jgi:murein DD-endopeptidase MepM/ murein hydrolase activator NlpD